MGWNCGLIFECEKLCACARACERKGEGGSFIIVHINDFVFETKILEELKRLQKNVGFAGFQIPARAYRQNGLFFELQTTSRKNNSPLKKQGVGGGPWAGGQITP